MLFQLQRNTKITDLFRFRIHYYMRTTNSLHFREQGNKTFSTNIYTLGTMQEKY